MEGTCMHLPQRNVNSSTPRTTAPGPGVRNDLWDMFLRSQISFSCTVARACLSATR